MANPEYELYYWQGFAGRGEFVRLLFEEAGVPYRQCQDNEAMVKMFKQQELKGYPCFAVPMVKKGEFQLGQTSVVCEYLGKEFGLYPEVEGDLWHARMLNATIHDYIGEGRLCFHGKDFYASYHDQKEETKPYIECFLKTRLAKFFSYFERALKANRGGEGYLVGDKLTFVDLGLLHILRATEAQFPEAYRSADAPLLKAFAQRISARPKLAAYFKSDRCQPFCGDSMM